MNRLRYCIRLIYFIIIDDRDSNQQINETKCKTSLNPSRFDNFCPQIIFNYSVLEENTTVFSKVESCTSVSNVFNFYVISPFTI